MNTSTHIDRRVLDRDQPARALTVTDDGGPTYWVIAGRGEELTESHEAQKNLIALHNLLYGHSTKDEVALILRDDTSAHMEVVR